MSTFFLVAIILILLNAVSLAQDVLPDFDQLKSVFAEYSSGKVLLQNENRLDLAKKRIVKRQIIIDLKNKNFRFIASNDALNDFNIIKNNLVKIYDPLTMGVLIQKNAAYLYQSKVAKWIEVPPYTKGDFPQKYMENFYFLKSTFINERLKNLTKAKESFDKIGNSVESIKCLAEIDALIRASNENKFIYNSYSNRKFYFDLDKGFIKSVVGYEGDNVFYRLENKVFDKYDFSFSKDELVSSPDADTILLVKQANEGKFDIAHYGITGFFIEIEGGQVHVKSVSVGSPADVAGLKKGQKIIKLNGKELKNMSEKDVYMLLTETEVVVLSLLNDDGTLSDLNIKKVAYLVPR